jgi:hypothetical protein
MCQIFLPVGKLSAFLAEESAELFQRKITDDVF